MESDMKNPARAFEDKKDVTEDPQYICKSCTLVTKALQRGGDVMQLPNGDIIITELKRVSYHYNWDETKGKMVKFSMQICAC